MKEVEFEDFFTEEQKQRILTAIIKSRLTSDKCVQIVEWCAMKSLSGIDPMQILYMGSRVYTTETENLKGYIP